MVEFYDTEEYDEGTFGARLKETLIYPPPLVVVCYVFLPTMICCGILGQDGWWLERFTRRYINPYFEAILQAQTRKISRVEDQEMNEKETGERDPEALPVATVTTIEEAELVV